MAGIILIILGFFPKFAALINTIPQPVLGGVGIVMFGTIAAAGIKTLSTVRNLNCTYADEKAEAQQVFGRRTQWPNSSG